MGPEGESPLPVCAPSPQPLERQQEGPDQQGRTGTRWHFLFVFLSSSGVVLLLRGDPLEKETEGDVYSVCTREVVGQVCKGASTETCSHWGLLTFCKFGFCPSLCTKSFINYFMAAPVVLVTEAMINDNSI